MVFAHAFGSPNFGGGLRNKIINPSSNLLFSPTLQIGQAFDLTFKNFASHKYKVRRTPVNIS